MANAGDAPLGEWTAGNVHRASLAKIAISRPYEGA